MLRTHPPSYASAAAVDALTFSGTYPVTRLNVADASLGAKMSVYGYSTLKPTDLKVQCASLSPPSSRCSNVCPGGKNLLCTNCNVHRRLLSPLSC